MNLNLWVQINYIPECEKKIAGIISELLEVSLRNHGKWERCQTPWEKFYFAICWE